MQLVELKIPAKAEFVSLARLVVSTLADDKYEMNDDQLDNLKLAVSEACVMVIEANGSPDGMITLGCSGSPERLEVIVGEQGTEFSLDGSSDDRLNVEQQIGLPLIDSLVDETQVEKVDGGQGSQLRMTVYCTRAEEL